MAQTNSRFFSVMVVGDNHKELMEKYSLNVEVEPYVRYEYLKADKYRNNSIKALTNLLLHCDEIGLEPHIKENLEKRVKSLSKMTPFEYYRELTDGMYYDNNGNALSSENPNGHWKTAKIGKNFSLPLKLKDGSETYSARVRDIDWESMNEPRELYEAAWEMVMEGRKPTNEREEMVYNSMKDKQGYFSNFHDKEDYVNYSTSYWNYAVVNNDEWVDMTNKDEKEWINTFHEKFIKPLKDDDLITIYECSVNNG